MALADVPGLGAFYQRRQMIEQEPVQQLQQAQGAMGLLANLQKMEQEKLAAGKEAQFRSEVAALGPNPSPETLAQVAAKYAPPKDVLATQTASADRQASLAAKAEEARARLEQRQQNADMIHEFRMSRAASDAEKAAETARHNKAREELAAQNATFQNELRRMGLQVQQDRAADQRTRQSQVQVQQLGTALERASLPEADAVLRGVEDALKKTPAIAEYLSGPKSLLPDLAVDQNIREGRQAFQKLFNITLKTRSGAAVTNQELERLKQEFATGVFKTPEQLQAAVTQARKIISDHYRSVAAGFGPDVLKSYNDNLRSTGGTAILEPGDASPAPAPAPTPAPAKFEEGKVYVDGKGNKAKFQGGKFVPVR